MDQNFSTLIFGKPLDQISLKDLQEYFKEPKNESDKLEFKSYPSAASAGGAKEIEKKILKTICAFLNSEGGLLVWGAPEKKTLPGTTEEGYQGNLTPTSDRLEKDSFISKIANRIIPSPKGILFHRVDEQNKYAYVLEVPSSEYAPHQFENVYYMRADGQTIAAPHHYIEALFRKVSFPRLEAYLRIDGYQLENSDNTRLSCTVYFRNRSRYQNDFNVQCRVITDQGKLVLRGLTFSPMDRQIQEGSDYSSPYLTDVIYYGNWLPFVFDIILSKRALYETRYEFLLVLTFGAKHSPMKLCNYTIQVGPNPPQIGRSSIIRKEENLFIHENEEAIGTTDEENLERFLSLGQKPR